MQRDLIYFLVFLMEISWRRLIHWIVICLLGMRQLLIRYILCRLMLLTPIVRWNRILPLILLLRLCWVLARCLTVLRLCVKVIRSVIRLLRRTELLVLVDCSSMMCGPQIKILHYHLDQFGHQKQMLIFRLLVMGITLLFSLQEIKMRWPWKGIISRHSKVQ